MKDLFQTNLKINFIVIPDSPFSLQFVSCSLEPLLHGGAWRLLDHSAGSSLAFEPIGADSRATLAGGSQLLQRTAAATSGRSLSQIVTKRSALSAAPLSSD
jgi:hypothetical protein